MKRVNYLIVFLFLLSCDYRGASEFEQINEVVSYQYHQFGEGLPVDAAFGIAVDLVITDTIGDTLHYVPAYPYFFPLKNTSIDSAWRDFRVGDSVSFLVPRVEMNQNFKFYEVQQSDSGVVLMHARILGAYSSKEIMEQAEKKVLSKREIDEQAELKKYLKKLPYSLDTIGDIYLSKMKSVEGEVEEIKYGSEVSLHYKGHFLNGYVFDNTYEKGITPSFEFGRNYQLIDGMQMGLKGLKKGEKVKIILSSRRAFGEVGSLAGIVPPYTAVIYDVHIINVIN